MTSTKRAWGKIRSLPSGRWQASYRGPDQVRYFAPQTFIDSDAAVIWLNRERRLIELDEWTSPYVREAEAKASNLTLGEYVKPWLTDRTLKPRTRHLYQTLLDRFILPELDGVEMRALTPTMVRQWHARVAPGTPTQRSQAYGLLRTIMNSAVREELIERNPCTIPGAASVARARRIEPATVEQVEIIANAVPEKYRAMILLAAWCALRFGELAELRRRDFDLAKGVINVRRAIVRVGGVVIVGTPKSRAGIRSVSIPPHLLPGLRRHLQLFATPGRDGLLFPSTTGSQLAESTVARVFRRARKLAGRDDLAFHHLRHTGAVLAATSGATLSDLMNRLGHSTAGAALLYQHAAQDRDLEIARRLSLLAGFDPESKSESDRA